MALQGSGQISLGDIATEFGGSQPHALSEYYGKGNAPGSGQIRMANDFYGTSNFSYSGLLDYAGIGNEGSSSFNFGTRNFGTADASRIIVVVGNTSYGTSGVSSVSIGGSNGTIHHQTGGTYSRSWVSSRAVPSGTSGNVTVNFSGGSGRVGIAVYAMYGLDPSNYSPVGSNGGANCSYSRSVTTRAGGVAFGTGSDADGMANRNWTNLNEDVYFSPSHGSVVFASALTTTTGSTTFNYTNSSSCRGSVTYVAF